MISRFLEDARQPDRRQRDDVDGEQDDGEQAVAAADQVDEADGAREEHAQHEQHERESEPPPRPERQAVLDGTGGHGVKAIEPGVEGLADAAADDLGDWAAGDAVGGRLGPGVAGAGDGDTMSVPQAATSSASATGMTRRSDVTARFCLETKHDGRGASAATAVAMRTLVADGERHRFGARMAR